MRIKYSQNYKNIIINRIKNGESIKSISDSENISRPTLYKWKDTVSIQSEDIQPKTMNFEIVSEMINSEIQPKTMEKWIEELEELKNQKITHGRLCRKRKCKCDIYNLAGAIRQKYIKSNFNLTADRIDYLANKYLDLYKNDKSYRHEIFYTALSNLLQQERYDKSEQKNQNPKKLESEQINQNSNATSVYNNVSNLISISHKLSIAPSYFKDIKNKIKTFEIRKNDKQFKIGDHLLLLECDIKFDNGQTGFHYTGRGIFVRIIYILHNVYGILDDFVALGFEHLENSKDFENVDFNMLKELKT